MSERDCATCKFLYLRTKSCPCRDCNGFDKYETATAFKNDDKPRQALEIENASLKAQLETAQGDLKQLKSLVAQFAELVRMEDPHNIEVKGLPF